MAASVDRVLDHDNTVSFVHLLASSSRFKELFDEGMQMVEEAAAYLDGQGRLDSKLLSRSLSIAYQAESMRLTTRLMQIASWLLIRRAVSAGEMTPAQATAERLRVRITAHDLVSGPSVFAQMPEALQSLTRRSMRLQTRILHLDRMVNEAETETDPHAGRRGLDVQLDKLRSVYGQHA